MHTTSDDVIGFDKYDEPRLHMEQLLKAHLIEFDFSMRILCPLERAGIRTLGDLVKQSEESLKMIYGLGKLSLTQIDKFLKYHDLSLCMK